MSLTTNTDNTSQRGNLLNINVLFIFSSYIFNCSVSSYSVFIIHLKGQKYIIKQFLVIPSLTLKFAGFVSVLKTELVSVTTEIEI